MSERLVKKTPPRSLFLNHAWGVMFLFGITFFEITPWGVQVSFFEITPGRSRCVLIEITPRGPSDLFVEITPGGFRCSLF